MDAKELLDCIWKQMYNARLNVLHPTFTIWINKSHEREFLIGYQRELPIEIDEMPTRVTKLFEEKVLVAEDIIGEPVVEVHVRRT